MQTTNVLCGNMPVLEEEGKKNITKQNIYNIGNNFRLKQSGFFFSDLDLNKTIMHTHTSTESHDKVRYVWKVKACSDCNV